MSSSCCRYFKSSIVRKQIMGITGLLLCGFLISHMIGNFLLFCGSDTFNTYAYTLTSNPLIYLAEAILAAIFFSHLGLAFKLTVENNQARPVKYAAKTKTGRGATFASSTMPFTGGIILVFLVLHLIHFKFGPMYTAQVNGVEMRDLYKTVIEYFASPLNVIWYIFAMVALGIHVSHGFWSAFQSLGFNHPKYNNCLKMVSKIYAVVITLGFSSMPIYCFIQAKGGL